MNVATALNRKYLPYTGVMLYSFCVNNPGHVDAYILHHELEESDLLALDDALSCFDITIHSMRIDPEGFCNKMYTDKVWTVEAYYRLMLFDILPEDVDRLLYFDVDLIINKNLRGLYELDFEGKDLVVCEDDCGNCTPERYGPMHRKIFGAPEWKEYRYFNSGVMLMNIEKLRKEYSYEYYMDVAHKVWNYRMEAPDQDLLNYVHGKQVKYVPYEFYNLFGRIAHYSQIPVSLVREKVSIIHYTWLKPWDGTATHYPLEQIWWDYARQSSFYPSIAQKFIEDTISNNDADDKIRRLEELSRTGDQK